MLFRYKALSQASHMRSWRQPQERQPMQSWHRLDACTNEVLFFLKSPTCSMQEHAWLVVESSDGEEI